MTNLHKNFGTIATLALFILLVGCKKEEETFSSFVLDTESLDFEYGQTKEVTFSSLRAKSFRVGDVPDGWNCIYSDGKYIITSPAEGDPSAELDGNIEVLCSSNSGTPMERTIEVAVRIAEEIPAAANSIIISTPGKRYKFNARRRGNETMETLTGMTDAVRLWTTSSQAVRNVSLENDYVYFSTGDYNTLAEGNAVIAVRDAKKNVLWSWHIWAVADDPTAEPDIIDGQKVMNRNLGATTNSNTTEGNVLRSYGLYYQWGRKDPFTGPNAWDSSIPRTIYDNSGTTRAYNFEVSSEKIGTVEYAVAHPDTFIAGAESSGFDWLYASRDNDLWSDTSKTLYDPCPEGWRVASPEIWKSFTSTGTEATNPDEFNVTGEYTYGWTFINGEGTIYYPAAGRRSFSPTLASSTRNFTNVVNDENGVGSPVGFYWSSKAPVSDALSLTASNGARSLSFDKSRINPASNSDDYSATARAGGFPLRCVAE